MGEFGHFTDTKGTTIRVVAEEGNIRVYADPQPGYEDPSPHMNVDMVMALLVLLTGPVKVGGSHIPLEATQRGFTSYGDPIIDLDGHEVYVQESSAVGAPCAWLFCNDPKPRQQRYEDHKLARAKMTSAEWKRCLPSWMRDPDPEQQEAWLYHQWPGEPDDPKSPTPNLTPEMADEVAMRLAAFIQDAGAPDNWRNSPEYRAVWRNEDEDEDAEA